MGGTSREDGPVDVRSLVQGEWLELEIGPGRGGFVFERAAAAPAGLIGLEVRRKWATIVDQRLAKAGLGARARVFAEDAGLALPRLGPDGSIRRIFLHFPDPWWKKRHAKRLVIVKQGFVAEMARLLEPGGELFVQTDVEERAALYEAEIRACPLFVPFGDEGGSPALANNPYNAESPREKRAIVDGLPVHRLRFRRV
ncbi:tRNA (guanine(46)-N(7))-methyltransferase TrmB [Pendulispora albinea]|uniref:tRNA (guanine(46)-N(7))-methyltransferase n=1 Tax=Pendulispora albinea TaxID=2741071 RepID=A0ABZ2M3Y2_9BACT